MNLEKNKNFLFLTLISLIYVSLSLIAIFRDDVIFPFVQYQMFHRLLLSPQASVYQAYGVSGDGKEHLINRRLIRSYSVREEFEIYKFVSAEVGKALSKHKAEIAHKMFPQFVEIRIYESICSCSDYYKTSPQLDVASYAQSKCDRKLLFQEKYEGQ